MFGFSRGNFRKMLDRINQQAMPQTLPPQGGLTLAQLLSGPQGTGGMLSRFAQQFRNAEAMPSNWVSAPRTLTPEEQIAITSRPATGMRMVETPRYMPPPPPLPVMPPPEREVIGFKTPPPGVRSGDTRIFADQPVPQPVTRQPFDPNAALQAFNKRAAELNASGKGLFASGMVPDEFRMYQGVLRNLQLNPNSTPEQHADILNKSMAFLNQYSGATPQPMVDPNVPYRPTGPDAFYGAPPAPLQQTPQNARGMALGGLMAKYRGGMC